MSKFIEQRECPLCGTTDRFRVFSKNYHYTQGVKCEGKPVTVRYTQNDQAIESALIDLANAAVNIQNGNPWEAIAFINRATARLRGDELK